MHSDHTALTPGTYALTDTAYNELPALRSSDIAPALLSWAHFRAAKMAPREDTDAFRVGRLVHAAVRGVAEQDFVVLTGPLNPKTNKAYGTDTLTYREWLEQARAVDRREIVTPHEWREAEAIAEAVHASGPAAAAIADAKAEVSFVGRIEGVECKARVDYWRAADASWSDVKTTRESATVFSRVACRLQYPLKAAFQALVMESALRARPEMHRWVVVEKDAPHGVMVYRMSAADLLPWCDKVRQLVSEYAGCVASGKWPGYAGGEVDLEVRPWDMPILNPQPFEADELAEVGLL